MSLALLSSRRSCSQSRRSPCGGLASPPVQSQGPALPTKVVSSWFLVGSVYIRTHPCALWLAEDPISEWPGFWETELNSTLPSLKIQAALMVSLLGRGPGPGLPLAPPQGDNSSVPTPASGQGQPAQGAGMLPFTCRAWCLCSAAPVVLSGLRDSTLLTALLPHCCSFLLQPSLTCLQERTCAAVLREGQGLSAVSLSQWGGRGGDRGAG